MITENLTIHQLLGEGDFCIQAFMSEPTSTEDYRKYPGQDPSRRPNFLLIVVMASIVLLLGMVAAYLLLHHDSKKMLPHGPNSEPNALIMTALPSTRLA